LAEEAFGMIFGHEPFGHELRAEWLRAEWRIEFSGKLLFGVEVVRRPAGSHSFFA
jgi:hypothetical protein